MTSTRRFSVLIGLAVVLALVSGHAGYARSLMVSCEKRTLSPEDAAAACLELLSDPSLSVEDKVALLRWRIKALEGMYDQEIALIAVNQWLALRPDSAEPMRVKAALLHDLEATQAAYDLIDEAISAFPNDFSLLKTRFDFLTRDKRQSEAWDLAEETIHSYPERAEGWGMRGFARLGQIGNVLSEMSSGKSFAEDQRVIMAAEDFRKAVAIDSSLPDNVKGFFTACVILAHNCPSLFDIGEVVSTHEKACDLTLQEAIVRVERRFTSESTGYDDMAQALKAGQAAIDDLSAGGERALRVSLENYIRSAITLRNYLDVDAASQVLLFDRLSSCLANEVPGAFDLASLRELGMMFDVLYHQKLRENLRDLAHFVLAQRGKTTFP